MMKNTVIYQLGSRLKVAKKLKISSSAVSQWKEIIPEKQALKLEKLTKGELIYNSSLYRKSA